MKKMVNERDVVKSINKTASKNELLFCIINLYGITEELKKSGNLINFGFNYALFLKNHLETLLKIKLELADKLNLRSKNKIETVKDIFKEEDVIAEKMYRKIIEGYGSKERREMG